VFFLLVVLLIVSYLIGSIPTGLILGKTFYRRDLRRLGSGNIGATNAFRVLGKKGGAAVFLIDFFKGEIAVLLGMTCIGSPEAMMLCGLFAIIGNIFSIFMQLKGGKGVSTTLGVLSILMPKVALAVVIAWGAVVFATRYVSLGSITAAIMAPIFTAFLHYNNYYIIFMIIVMAFIIAKHRENLERLRKGRENRF
jgi:glycerol-3-phosphate acyltransferase PlsY